MGFFGDILKFAAPIVGLGATFATGGAAAPWAFGSRVLGGLGALNGIMGGGQQQGGQQNPLGQIAGMVGPAMATNALARGNWKVAEQLMNSAADRQRMSTDDATKRYQGFLSQYRDPALSGGYGPAMVGGYGGVNAPFIGSVRPNHGYVPQHGYGGGYASPFGLYGGGNPGAVNQFGAFHPASSAPHNGPQTYSPPPGIGQRQVSIYDRVPQ